MHPRLLTLGPTTVRMRMRTATVGVTIGAEVETPIETTAEGVIEVDAVEEAADGVGDVDAVAVAARGGMARRGENNPGNNLHVSGLSHKIDTRELEEAFGKMGRVKKASVMYDPHTRESRGFGFVTMETPEEADAAVAALNGSELGGKAIHVEKARRGRARTPTPGRYHGPPKRGDDERPYDPRPYDSRYSRDRDGDDRGPRGSGGGGGRERYNDNHGYRGRDDHRGEGRDNHRGSGRGGREHERGGGRDYDERGHGSGGGGGGGGRGERGGGDERRY
ncbi:hypothetical protein B0H19DRAFT_1385375 [Mycena capillaripes]|nr:hypothetical protein B0H19DRAFT_1385375 [Mycena capillaripes]